MANYELTYDLPGANGGHRAESREYSDDALDTDALGYPSERAEVAMAAARKDLQERVAQLALYGARNLRVNDHNYIVYL